MQAFIRICEYAKDRSRRFACAGDEWPVHRRIGRDGGFVTLICIAYFIYLFIYLFIYFWVLAPCDTSRIWGGPLQFAPPPCTHTHTDTHARTHSSKDETLWNGWMRALSFHRASFALPRWECLGGSYCKSFVFVYLFIPFCKDFNKASKEVKICCLLRGDITCGASESARDGREASARLSETSQGVFLSRLGGLRCGGQVSREKLFSSLFSIAGAADGGCQDNGSNSQTKTSFMCECVWVCAYFLRGVEIH